MRTLRLGAHRVKGGGKLHKSLRLTSVPVAVFREQRCPVSGMLTGHDEGIAHNPKLPQASPRRAGVAWRSSLSFCTMGVGFVAYANVAEWMARGRKGVP